MIILLGGSGYIGQAFASELEKRKLPFKSVSRAQIDYSRFDVLLRFLRDTKPTFLINAAGYTGKPNVDACEIAGGRRPGQGARGGLDHRIRGQLEVGFAAGQGKPPHPRMPRDQLLREGGMFRRAGDWSFVLECSPTGRYEASGGGGAAAPGVTATRMGRSLDAIAGPL